QHVAEHRSESTSALDAAVRRQARGDCGEIDGAQLIAADAGRDVRDEPIDVRQDLVAEVADADVALLHAVSGLLEIGPLVQGVPDRRLDIDRLRLERRRLRWLDPDVPEIRR